MTDEADAVWVESDRTHNDRYVATVHPTPDVSIPLDHVKATAYAMTVVIRVVAYAEYDAATVRQFQALPGGDLENAAALVAMLRERRKAVDAAATAPLVFTGGVSARTGEPFVHVGLSGKALTQWTPDEARGHALYVLDCAVVAGLDQSYLAFLVDEVKLDRETALVAVDDLAQHRAGQRYEEEA